MQSGIPESNVESREPSGESQADGTLSTPPLIWWRSRAVWGALVAIVAAALRLFDVEIAYIQPEITEIVFELATLIGGIVAAEGRLSATRRLTVTKNFRQDGQDGQDSQDGKWVSCALCDGTGLQPLNGLPGAEGRCVSCGGTGITQVSSTPMEEKAARGVVGLLVIGALGIACFFLAGCSVTGSIFYPVEGGKIAIGVGHEFFQVRPAATAGFPRLQDRSSTEGFAK